MIWLILGVLIWSDTHLYKRYAPNIYEALTTRLGARYRLVFSALMLLSIVLMVIGFRQMGTEALYHPPAFLMPIASIILFFAVVFLGLSHSKSTYRGRYRHPMLMGVIMWGVAHLMMFGEWRAIILFGGMILWAVAEILAINKAEPNYTPLEPGDRKGGLRLLVISAVVYVVIIGLHILIIRGF